MGRAFVPVPPVPLASVRRLLSLMATVDGLVPEQLERGYGITPWEAQQALLGERSRRAGGRAA